MHEFEEIEQAVITALASITDQGVHTLAMYTGQVEPYDVEALVKSVHLFPCVFVLASGAALTFKDRYDEEVIGVTLFCGARNLRGADAARRGDDSSIGVYDVLEMTEALLHRQKIHTAGALRLRMTEPLYMYPQHGMCVYAAHYEFTTLKVGHT